MHNYRDFADVFDFDLSGCYNRKQVGEIEGYRKRFQGLFVDKVLKLVGVEKRMLHFSSALLGLRVGIGVND